MRKFLLLWLVGLMLVPSVMAERKKVGLVLGKDAGMAVTCRLWDATPCDFCCHNIDRDNDNLGLATHSATVMLQYTF